MAAHENGSNGAGGPQGAGKRELLERFREQMLATARRYSASDHDADDAYQRAAEILLTHSPRGSEDELCRWLRTTVKHEALAIRRQRERVTPAGEAEHLPEPPTGHPDAHEQAEHGERLRLGVQALGRLKPQEIRCLLLKAEGYSYREICERTGFSYTKVNRSITEGRRAFLARVASIESGAECERLAPQLSLLADGEASAEDLAAARPHLRSCLSCRARLRDYRAVPARVAALAPAVVLAAGGPDGGRVRSFVESLVGTAQHKAAGLGERAHQAVELAGGQKAAAVAASAAALAGGGAVTAERLAERGGAGERPAAEVRHAEGKLPSAPEPAPQPPAEPSDPAPPSPTATPTPPATPPAPAPVPKPEPEPPPKPANEFAPDPAAAQAAPASRPQPAASAPAPVTPSGASGSSGGSAGGGGEFGP